MNPSLRIGTSHPDKRPKKTLDKIDSLCIIDSSHKWRLFDHDNEKDEFLFSGFANQKAKSDSKENWFTPFRHSKASD